MGFMDFYRATKAREDAEHAARVTQDEQRERAQQERIVAALQEAGVEAITTNGYWYAARYRGLVIHFVNQTTRILGAIHRPAADADEAAALREGHRWKLRPDFQQEFRYYDFVLPGDPVAQIPYVLEIARSAADAAHA